MVPQAAAETSTAAATPSRPRWRKGLANALIAVIIATIAIDAMPQVTLFQSKAQEKIDVVLDVTGYWQGAWTLFAPNPDRLNERLYATVEFDDGRTATWSSPDWRAMTPLERFTSFRRLEYFDDVAGSATPELFGRLADFIVTEVAPPSPNAQPVRVTIDVSRNVMENPQISFEPIDAYLDFGERTTLHVEEYG